MLPLKTEFQELLKEFDRLGVLDKFIVIGSWAKEIYMENLPIRNSVIRTHDIDFSLIDPRLPYSDSVNDLLVLMEYKPELTIYSKSVTYFPSSEKKKMNIDFLCSYSRKITKPTKIPGLNIVVTPLKYQDILIQNIIVLPYMGITVKVPSPEIWAIHKISISQQREGTRLQKIKKSMADLESTRELVEHFGIEKLNQIANEKFRGKFLNFYEKGIEKLKELGVDFDRELETGLEL